MSLPARTPHDAWAELQRPASHELPRATALTDPLGERHLVFDPRAGVSLELLQLAPEFSAAPEFEVALRARVDALRHLQHPSIGIIQGVERDGDSLTLVSRHTAGRRISELLPKAHGPGFALELIRLVTPALVALQESGDDVAHGLLSADRIIVTRDGRLVVVEHVLGSAVATLGLTRERLLEMGLAAPVAKDGESVVLDGRFDLTQLGFLALSLLIGRRLDPSLFPASVPALLDEFTAHAGSSVLATRLRAWIERAMQFGPQTFANAGDAQAALADLPDDPPVHVAPAASTLVPFPRESTAAARPAAKPVAEFSAPAPVRRGIRWGRWAMAGVALLAVAEGVILFVQPYLRPATEVVELSVRPAATAAPAAVLPPSALLAADPAAAAAGGPTAGAAAPLAPNTALAQSSAPSAPAGSGAPIPAATDAAAVAPGPRFGGLTVASRIDLQVLEGGRLLGSTAGPIAINEGPHTVELVNEQFGFRLTQTVNVRGGRMTTINIEAPKGRLSINAVPWADVDIDGAPAGQTPIANVALPIGIHEITFRHPTLGTRTQSVTVKVDGLAKVTQTFQPGGDR